MEIGSEFNTNSAEYGINKYYRICDWPNRYVLSGRTGLYLVAEQIKEAGLSIALPDYCCESMIKPFLDQNFKIIFYSAFDLKNTTLDSSIKTVLVVDYFGFLSDETVEFVCRCKKEGKTIIVDATQSAFSRCKTYEIADYIVISYRKWLDSFCAVVYSKDGFSKNILDTKTPSYVDSWRNAANIKEQYIKFASVKKEDFLPLYAMANRELGMLYKDCQSNAREIEVIHKVDSDILRQKRRENAIYLINEVKKLSEFFDIQLLFDVVKNEDCPLFVPILVDESKRNAIRNLLIKNDVYCPIHWPIDKRYAHRETVYHKKEMSLICDQRYGIKEMKRQIAVLSQALKTFDA